MKKNTTSTTATEGRLGSVTNIDGKPFDFQKWCLWLELRGKELLADGYKCRYGFTDMHNSPKAGLGVSSDNAIGDFRIWAQGYCDFEVLDTKSRQPLVDKMGLILDDSSFETAFEDFRQYLKLLHQPAPRGCSLRFMLLLPAD